MYKSITEILPDSIIKTLNTGRGSTDAVFVIKFYLQSDHFLLYELEPTLPHPSIRATACRRQQNVDPCIGLLRWNIKNGGFFFPPVCFANATVEHALLLS